MASASVKPRVRWTPVVGLVVTAGLLAAYTVSVVRLLATGDEVSDFFGRWVYDAVALGAAAICLMRPLLVKRERAAWALLGAGILAWALGQTYYSIVLYYADPAPYPSPADIGFLAFYPACFGALALLFRSRARHLAPFALADALIGAFGAASVAAALIFPPVLDALGGSGLGVGVSLAYPIADLVLVGMVVGVMVAARWRSRGAWLLIGSALLLFCAADIAYLSAAGQATTVLDVASIVWPLALLLMAGAAWIRGPTAEVPDRLPDTRLGLPVFLGSMGVAVIAAGNFVRVGAVAFGLAAAGLLAVGVRFATTVRQNSRMLAATRHQALVDHLTKLRNHRAFQEDLERELARAGRGGTPLSLVLLDLDDLKKTNDSQGHQAGDMKLCRLAETLREACRDSDAAYRIGGDEFAVIAPDTRAWGAYKLIERMNERLEESNLPRLGTAGIAEAGPGIERAELIRHADLALLSAKATRHPIVLYSPELETGLDIAWDATNEPEYVEALSSALARAVDAKDTVTRGHSETVAAACVVIGTRLGLSAEKLRQLRLAGLLHDVGKIGIPDAILGRPGPLSETEGKTMREHTRIGFGILSAAALPTEAEWILRHHERIDGTGYPDGLAGDEIPLESRILAVADAFAAMTSDRPYSRRRSEGDALEELDRHAGTQFDPLCVEALRMSLQTGALATNGRPVSRRGDARSH